MVGTLDGRTRGWRAHALFWHASGSQTYRCLCQSALPRATPLHVAYPQSGQPHPVQCIGLHFAATKPAPRATRPTCAGQRHIVAAIAACSKPDAAGLQQLVGLVGEQMQKASSLAEGRRGAAVNHCKAVAEALQCLSWVVYSGPGCGELAGLTSL